MNIYARQGDLVIDKLKAPITGELERATNLVLAGSTSGFPHTLRGSVLHRREGRRTLLRVPEPTVIEHAGRHRPVTLEAGDYEIHPLREAGDRAVED